MLDLFVGPGVAVRARPLIFLDIDGVLGLCRPLCRGRYARSISKLLDYYDRNRHRMTYAAFRRMRIPAGSGIVESAIRRIVNLRLKGPGIFWTPRSAEAVLHLRAALKSGRWHELVVSALTWTPQFTETPTQTEFPRAM